MQSFKDDVQPFPFVLHILKYAIHNSSVLLELGAVSHVLTIHLVDVESKTQELPSDVSTLSQSLVYLSHVYFAATQPIPSKKQPVFPVLQSYSLAGETIALHAVTVHFPLLLASSMHLPSDPIYYEHV